MPIPVNSTVIRDDQPPRNNFFGAALGSVFNPFAQAMGGALGGAAGQWLGEKINGPSAADELNRANAELARSNLRAQQLQQASLRYYDPTTGGANLAQAHAFTDAIGAPRFTEEQLRAAPGIASQSNTIRRAGDVAQMGISPDDAILSARSPYDVAPFPPPAAVPEADVPAPPGTNGASPVSVPPNYVTQPSPFEQILGDASANNIAVDPQTGEYRGPLNGPVIDPSTPEGKAQLVSAQQKAAHDYEQTKRANPSQDTRNPNYVPPNPQQFKEKYQPDLTPEEQTVFRKALNMDHLTPEMKADLFKKTQMMTVHNTMMQQYMAGQDVGKGPHEIMAIAAMSHKDSLDMFRATMMENEVFRKMKVGQYLTPELRRAHAQAQMYDITGDPRFKDGADKYSKLTEGLSGTEISLINHGIAELYKAEGSNPAVYLNGAIAYMEHKRQERQGDRSQDTADRLADANIAHITADTQHVLQQTRITTAQANRASELVGLQLDQMRNTNAGMLKDNARKELELSVAARQVALQTLAPELESLKIGREMSAADAMGYLATAQSLQDRIVAEQRKLSAYMIPDPDNPMNTILDKKNPQVSSIQEAILGMEAQRDVAMDAYNEANAMARAQGIELQNTLTQANRTANVVQSKYQDSGIGALFDPNGYNINTTTGRVELSQAHMMLGPTNALKISRLPVSVMEQVKSTEPVPMTTFLSIYTGRKLPNGQDEQMKHHYADEASRQAAYSLYRNAHHQFMSTPEGHKAANEIVGRSVRDAAPGSNIAPVNVAVPKTPPSSPKEGGAEPPPEFRNETEKEQYYNRQRLQKSINESMWNNLPSDVTDPSSTVRKPAF